MWELMVYDDGGVYAGGCSYEGGSVESPNEVHFSLRSLKPMLGQWVETILCVADALKLVSLIRCYSKAPTRI